MRPVYGPAEALPPDFELQTIRRGTEWFVKSRLLLHPSWQERYDRPANMGPPTEDWPWGHRTGPGPDPSWAVGDGSLGMLEGFRSRILCDGSQAVLWWRRHDNSGEIAGALTMAGTLLNDERFRQIGGNFGDWLYTKSLLTQGDRADLNNSAFGLAGWNDVPRYYGNLHGYDVYYADDNARGMLGMIKAAAALQTDRWDERLAQCLLANLRITSQLGFSPERIDGPLPPDQWRSRFDSQFTFFCPHHQAYLQACYLWAYRQSGDRLFLDRAKSAIRLTMEAYPDRWTWTNGQITLERARFLLPLAWLVRVEDTPEHRAWLDRMVNELLADQVECGAIRTRIVRSPTSNEAYGTGETSLVEQNGDPVSDLLYECQFRPRWPARSGCRHRQRGVPPSRGQAGRVYLSHPGQERGASRAGRRLVSRIRLPTLAVLGRRRRCRLEPVVHGNRLDASRNSGHPCLAPVEYESLGVHGRQQDLPTP